MLQERNQRSRNRSDLVGGYVHQIDFRGLYNGEIALVACFDSIVDKRAILVQWGIRLSNDFRLLFLGREVQGSRAQFHLTVLYFAVGCFDEAHAVHLRVDTERRNQTDVGSFWRFNGAKASVVSVVDVTNFEAGAFAAQTTGSESGQTALVRDFRQGVCLVHELAQLICSKEGIDH